MCSVQSEQLWAEPTKTSILQCAIGNTFVAVATTNSQLQIFSNLGRRILPAIILEAPVSFMDANESHVMVITSKGAVYVWCVLSCRIIAFDSFRDLAKQQSVVSSISVLPILKPGATQASQLLSVSSIQVQNDGTPLVRVANGSSYIFDQSMKAWMQIEDLGVNKNLTMAGISLESRTKYSINALEVGSFIFCPKYLISSLNWRVLDDCIISRNTVVSLKFT